MTSPYYKDKDKMTSSLYLLTCPRLVRIVDNLESDGGIERYNEKLEKSAELQDAMRQIHERHSKTRIQYVGEHNLARNREKFGRERADVIIYSGITGMTPTQVTDIKCLHAHLADYLCTGENIFGRMILDEIHTKLLIDTDGESGCWQMCDPLHALSEDSYW
eukprot:CAMPEP_0182450492 /NCGR_PEP_ID=MMETSP1172-20130603/41602_1 /TAXON_ID=708627 /ORGANISM="Timspurckia oligopyrenoides, Strain CCMP3278" /LENGTH=161 /DNA_ID=CAMNT_0024648109 /DNA_START=306 /DNA_END=788 /DNA_ORIENTATION=-